MFFRYFVTQQPLNPVLTGSGGGNAGGNGGAGPSTSVASGQDLAALFGLQFGIGAFGSVNVFKSSFNQQSLIGFNTLLPSSGSSAFIPDPVLNSTQVLKVTLNKSDPLVGGTAQATIYQNSLTYRDYTYRFSIYLPASFTSDPSSEALVQWHNTPDTGESANLIPPMQLTTRNGHFYIESRYDPNPITSGNPGPNGGIYPVVDLGTYQTGMWYDFTMYLKWSWLGDGFYSVSANGAPLYNTSGPNSYNDRSGPYLKLGIYKSEWVDLPSLSTTTQRIAYFRNVQVDMGDTRAVTV